MKWRKVLKAAKFRCSLISLSVLSQFKDAFIHHHLKVNRCPFTKLLNWGTSTKKEATASSIICVGIHNAELINTLLPRDHSGQTSELKMWESSLGWPPRSPETYEHNVRSGRVISNDSETAESDGSALRLDKSGETMRHYDRRLQRYRGQSSSGREGHY